MFILRAIGRFFARIWRWIKETAWVQPLLIVGGIFAIIFSIPYLTKWVKSWFNDTTASEKYYSSKKVSLKNAEDHKSDVDSLFDYLTTYANEGKVDEAALMEMGKKIGLNTDKMKKDADSQEIKDKLASNRAFTQTLKIGGVPMLIVNGDIHPGALFGEDLDNVVAASSK